MRKILFIFALSVVLAAGSASTALAVPLGGACGGGCGPCDAGLACTGAPTNAACNPTGSCVSAGGAGGGAGTGIAVPTVTKCAVGHAFNVGSISCSPQVYNLDGTNPDAGTCCVLDKVYTVMDWFFLIVIALAVIFILVAAFNFITAGGSAEKVGTARQYLIFGAVGIIVAILAKALPTIIASLVGLR